jgi:hypothetical protein
LCPPKGDKLAADTIAGGILCIPANRDIENISMFKKSADGSLVSNASQQCHSLLAVILIVTGTGELAASLLL